MYNSVEIAVTQASCGISPLSAHAEIVDGAWRERSGRVGTRRIQDRDPGSRSMFSLNTVSDELLPVDRGFILGASDSGKQVLFASVPAAGFVICFATELPTWPR